MRTSLALLAAVVCLWWLGLHAFVAALLVATCGAVVALVRLAPPRRAGLAAALAAPCVAAFVAEWPGAQEALYARARAGSWTLPEQASTWTLHAVMAAGGLLAGYPEVALEAARLHVPGADLRLAGDFPLRSHRVRDALARARSEPVRVLWPDHAHDDARVSLALNPADLRCDGATCTARVEVSYGFLERPTPLVPGVFAVYDGLFAALQRDGWLFPYTATWTFRAGGPHRQGPAWKGAAGAGRPRRAAPTPSRKRPGETRFGTTFHP